MNEVDDKKILREVQLDETDESIGVLLEDHIKIWDPETGDVQYEGRG